MERGRLKLVNKDEQFFEEISSADVPQIRKGKHHEIIAHILHDAAKINPGRAIRVPRKAFGSATLQHIRAALNRSAAKARLNLATSSDDEFLYVWRRK